VIHVLGPKQNARKDTVGSARLARMFLQSRGSSDEFGAALADRAIAQLPGRVDGVLVLDLGCGPGLYSAALAAAGAIVVSADIELGDVRAAAERVGRAMVADGRALPFADGSFDAVVCSNVLEHTPDPFEVLAEIERVLRPGGWGYVSWTNWLSPWGGHAVAPLHYLGPERSLRFWRRLFGEPTGKNLPGDGVWPTYVGETLRWVRDRDGLDLDAAYPRYWPWLSAIMRIPGVREVASWNCVLHVTRTGSPDC
jgi:SAM-dependent methyltransferase